MGHSNKLYVGELHYLKSLLHLQKGQAPVSSTALAIDVGVAPPTVTAMLKQLSKKGLADYTPYQGAKLTQKGRTAALSLEHKYTLARKLLTEILALPEELVHEEACMLEHAMSDTLAQHLEQLLTHSSEMKKEPARVTAR